MTNKRFLFLIFFILLIAYDGVAQKLNNTWAFGMFSGLNFNATPPEPLDSTNSQGVKIPYYISSISDKNGQLLFYTDGFRTWNGNHEIIPKYLFRWPWSGFVMPLICPYPQNDSLYYLFGVSQSSYANRLQYLTINMKHPEGEIIYPQPSTFSNYFTVLLQNASVVVAGTSHCNKKDTWIVSFADAALHSFLVTKEGVSKDPVVSAFTSDLPVSLNVGHSNIKFSANGEKFIIPLINKKKIVVMDFNNLTGVFSNPIILSVPNNNLLEDVEISADGSKLYIASYEVLDPLVKSEIHWIHQMDLNAGSGQAIEKTAFAMNGFGNSVMCGPRFCAIMNRTMQMGPDGKIYINMRNIDETISIIESPSVAGADAFYKEDYINVRKLYNHINVNYIKSGSFSVKENGILVRKQLCFGKATEFNLLFKNIDSVKWTFGDPASGDNQSTAINPSHTYKSPGKYNVTAVIYQKCFVDTAITQVEISTTKPIEIPSFIRDTTFCKGGSLVLDVTQPTATKYQWENGYIFPKREITKTGVYGILIFNECSYARHSFTVKMVECECRVFVPGAFSPNNDGVNDFFKPTAKCLAKDYRFMMYNRYGEKVFESAQINNGWDGNVNGKAAPVGVYIWTLQYRNPNHNEMIYQKGTAALLR